MVIYLLFLLAILPIIVLGYYTYSKDSAKEPIKILIKLFLGGLGAALLTIIFSILFHFIPFLKNDVEAYNPFQLFFYTFIVVALVEEVSKFIMTYKISYHDHAFDQLYDMIVYSVFVSLGFAWIENLLYSFEGGISTAVSRIFFAVPTHASVAVFMGYYLALSKLADLTHEQKKKKKYLICSIAIPTILHGTYDYLVYSNNYIVTCIFLLFVCLLYTKAHARLTKLASIKKSFLIQYCSSCGFKVEEGIYCQNCGNKLY